MKTLILISALFSINSFACQNMAPLSAIETYLGEIPVPGVLCQERPEDQCLCFDHIEGWDVAEVVDEKIQKPTYGSKENVTDCETEVSCEVLRPSLCSSIFGSYFFYAENLILPGYHAYCAKITGHEDVPTGKKILINSLTKIANKISKAQAKAQTEALIANGKKAREACNRVLDLIGGFNLLPGRTSEQAGQMTVSFEDALEALKNGRPGAAKTAILAIPVDGNLVTQPMKDLALAELAGY